MDESLERPSKIRKLSHDHQSTDADVAIEMAETAAASKDAGIPGSINDSTGETLAKESRDEVNEGDTTNSTSEPMPKSKVKPNSSLAGLAAAHPEMTKNQLKKLRRQEQWEADRGERKAKRKDRVIARREKKHATRQALIDSGMTEADIKQAMSNSDGRRPPQNVPIVFLIDCSYDDLMHRGEMTSLSAQITRAYGENRRAKYRGVVGVSSLTGKLRERFDTVLRAEYKGWKGFMYDERGFKDVSRETKNWFDKDEAVKLVGPFAEAGAANGPKQEMVELKAKGEVVYLSSESDNVLESLSPYGTYIVGGLVDKNREKGLCYRRACEAGIKTARLPIGEYLEMQSRKVLATNHVVEIMLKWLEHQSWEKAFLDVIPKRKGGKAKGDRDGSEEEDAAEEEGVMEQEKEPDGPGNAGLVDGLSAGGDVQDEPTTQ